MTLKAHTITAGVTNVEAILSSALQVEMLAGDERLQAGRPVVSLQRRLEVLVKSRAIRARQLRDMLDEVGVRISGTRVTRSAEFRNRMAALEKKLPALLWNCLQERLRQIEEIDRDISELEKQSADR